MRTKLYILLALFVGFSTGSFAQTATETQAVTTNLTEIRNITLTGGAVNIPIKRSTLGDTQYTNSAATFEFNHDLTVNQKVIVSTAFTGDATKWVGRSLWVGAVDTVPSAYWTAYGAIATQTLVLNGAIVGNATLLNNLPQNQVGIATGPITLNYSAAAGLSSPIGDASANITYNITDI